MAREGDGEDLNHTLSPISYTYFSDFETCLSGSTVEDPFETFLARQQRILNLIRYIIVN
jgi:hypothetical protein